MGEFKCLSYLQYNRDDNNKRHIHYLHTGFFNRIQIVDLKSVHFSFNAHI